MQLFFIPFTVYLFGVALAKWPKEKFVAIVKGGQDELGITGGKPASIEDFPYQAAVLQDAYIIGSGSVIGKRFILTSSFLLQPYLEDMIPTLQVRVGSADAFAGGQLFNVENITIHETYTNLYSYDVALVKLSGEIKYRNTVKPIRMASKKPKNASSVVLTGFGATEDIQRKGDHALLKAGKQIIVDKPSCQMCYKYISFDDSFICAHSYSICACNRDIGAPLVQGNEVVAFFLGGSYCCLDTKPQIYNDVPNIYDWVKKHLTAQGHDENENVGHYFGDY